MKTIQMEIIVSDNGDINVKSKTIGKLTDIETQNMVLGGIKHLMLIHEQKCSKLSWNSFHNEGVRDEHL